MSTSEYQTKIASMIRALEAEAPTIALRMGQTGLTLVKERSIRDGISVDGSFAAYSDTEVYRSSFRGKELNAGGRAYTAPSKPAKKGTWGGLRQAQGRSGGNVNLFYSGRMWSSLQVISQERNGYRYSVLTGASDRDAQAVLLGNLKRYGNFLKLTAPEVEQIQADAAGDVTDLVNQYL
ncbi:hypothetical protein DYU11_11515 [Fibrisoma montanum]|uniref:HK97 gp10 family phage protein n=1 Tax=Fibrisoma montanum TaxID=2305895 RepID=A0A418MB48_9BACT|nr:hypothetical protein [Fibrisoma montanum]RIV23602.1 hypothetical protein DYU11_11515 [Fibrisoma montanum]